MKRTSAARVSGMILAVAFLLVAATSMADPVNILLDPDNILSVVESYPARENEEAWRLTDGDYDTVWRADKSDWNWPCGAIFYELDRLYDFTSYSFLDAAADRVTSFALINAGSGATFSVITDTSDHTGKIPMTGVLSGRGGALTFTVEKAKSRTGAAELEIYGTPTAYLRIANPTIIDYAQAKAGFDVEAIFNGWLSWPNADQTYASNYKGTDTFITFDFGTPTLVSAIEFWDRSWTSTPHHDSALVTFSNVETFDSGSEIALTYEKGADEVYLLDIAALGTYGRGIEARYMKWEVTGLVDGSKTDVGLQEIMFYAIPEPSTLALLLGVAGFFGLGAVRRRVGR